VVLGRRAEATEVVVVPTSAIVRSLDTAYVFVRDPQGFTVRRVRILGTEGNSVFIADGPGPQREVAVAGVAALKALWLSGDGEGG